MPPFTQPYYQPSACLTGLVDWIYVMRVPAPFPRAQVGSLLPQVFWRLGGDFRWWVRPDRAEPLCGAGLMGPTSQALAIEARSPAVVAGAGLFPEGWAVLVGEPAHRLTGTMVDLGALWGDRVRRPLRHGPDADDAAIASAIDAVLVERLIRRPRRLDPRVATLGRWANGEAPAIDALTAELGVSHRQVDRLALASTGVPPRLFANKHRIMRIAATMTVAGPAATRDLWADEFADQSHFIRHFRRFIGPSPTAFHGEDGAAVRDMFAKRLLIRSPHALGLYVGD
jgi:AraC-like DNA-binding protein